LAEEAGEADEVEDEASCGQAAMTTTSLSLETAALPPRPDRSEK
jgi:hypothetical protein